MEWLGEPCVGSPAQVALRASIRSKEEVHEDRELDGKRSSSRSGLSREASLAALGLGRQPKPSQQVFAEALANSEAADRG
jgi:hypothetical protein